MIMIIIPKQLLPIIMNVMMTAMMLMIIIIILLSFILILITYTSLDIRVNSIQYLKLCEV